MTTWLFFDVGYTLLDETDAWDEQFGRFADLLADADDDTMTQLWRVYNAACQRFAPRQWKAVVEAFVPADQVERCMALSDGWRHDLEKPYPDALDTLRALAGRFKLGVIANQSLGTRDRLQKHGMLEFISLVVGSAEAGVSKPDPRIFQEALREAHCNAEDAVMVGDRLDNDIRPANLLGMKTVHIRQGGSGGQRPRDASETPTYTIDRLAELVAIFGQASST